MTEVILHVYDLTMSGKGNDTVNYMVVQMNKLLKDGINLGGVFHVAVQIYGEVEWAYGHRDKGSGIFSCPATKNPNYTYRESIPAGRTHCSSSKVNLILKELRDEWPGDEYSLVSRNSKHFCQELLEKLGVPKLPAWANRLANVGDTAKDVGNKLMQAPKDAFKFLKTATGVGAADSNSQPKSSSSSFFKPNKSKSKSQIENLPLIGFGVKSITKTFRVNAPVIALDDKPANRLPAAPACLLIEDGSESQTGDCKGGKKQHATEPIVEEPISDEEEYSDSEDEAPVMKNTQQKLKAMKPISAA
nr:deSI-like protein At4g17486 [Ipomoea batatas]